MARCVQAAIHGEGKIELTTCDIKDAVLFGQVIIIIVPAFGQVSACNVFVLRLPVSSRIIFQ
jgi:hypothetical protein